MFKIYHKHLATKTHYNKRQKISQTRLATILQKKKNWQTKEKIQNGQKNWRTEKMKKY